MLFEELGNADRQRYAHKDENAGYYICPVLMGNKVYNAEYHAHKEYEHLMHKDRSLIYGIFKLFYFKASLCSTHSTDLRIAFKAAHDRSKGLPRGSRHSVM